MVSAPATLTPPASDDRVTHAQIKFDVMGTRAHLLVDGLEPDRLLEMGHHRLEDLEQRWSRFLIGSEVSRWNAANGEPFAVSPDTWRLVQTARAAWRRTDGRFHPSMLATLRHLGYDRSFSRVGPITSEPNALQPAFGSPETIPKLDAERSTVSLASGYEFDPGGVGKGLAADIVAEELLDAGAMRVVVNLGGDLRIRRRIVGSIGTTLLESNNAIDPTVISIVEPAWSPEPIADVRLEDGALATSTTLRRRWQGPEGTRHHIVDPETGRSARSESGPQVVLASVIATDGWWAEAVATSLIVDPEYVPDRCSALVLFEDGTQRRIGDFNAYQVMP